MLKKADVFSILFTFFFISNICFGQSSEFHKSTKSKLSLMYDKCYASSDLVLEGKVTDIKVVFDPNFNMNTTQYHLQVLQQLKGQQVQYLIVTIKGGGNVELSHTTALTNQERYILYLNSTSINGTNYNMLKGLNCHCILK